MRMKNKKQVSDLNTLNTPNNYITLKTLQIASRYLFLIIWYNQQKWKEPLPLDFSIMLGYNLSIQIDSYLPRWIDFKGDKKSMSEPEPRRGREHNAQRTREALLNAAEAVFAEHGFDGARLDAIAQASGYNKSLIGQYFGDKLGLYTEVNKRMDRDMSELETRILTPLLADETIASDAHRFRTFLETAIGALFDYLLEHPRLIRIILWEQAEGWQTYTKILSQFETENTDQLRTLFSKAKSAGLLRSDFDPLIQLVLAEQMCWSYLASIPLYQTFLAGEDLASAPQLTRAREHIVAFIVHGMMVVPAETGP